MSTVIMPKHMKGRGPLLSGYCNVPSPDSHKRCNGGTSANPDKIFQPCPCTCHCETEVFECECGSELRIAPLWPVDDPDEGPAYVHIDPKTNRMTGEYCS